jgi:hypothetical protein
MKNFSTVIELLFSDIRLQQDLFFIELYRARNKWKILIEVGFIWEEQWFVDMPHTKKLWSKYLSPLESPAHLIDIYCYL